MRIPDRRLHLCMTEQLPDHRQSSTSASALEAKECPRVMESHIVEISTGSNASQRVLDFGEVGGAGLSAGDHPRIVLDTGQRRQDADCSGRAQNHARTSPRVAQPRLRRLKINIFLAQRLDFAEPAAGRHEQADGRHGRSGLLSLDLDVG